MNVISKHVHALMMCAALLVVPQAVESQLTLITVFTDKSSYKYGEIVTIFGSVAPVQQGTPVMILLSNSEGTIYSVGNELPRQDGSFTTQFKIAGKLAIEGMWGVSASYAGQEAFTTFILEPQPAISSDGTIYVELEHLVFNLKASLSTGVVRHADVDPEFMSLLLSITTSDVENGTLEVELPRQLLDVVKVDTKTGTKFDEYFVVVVDGVNVAYTEKNRASESRTLVIQVPAGTRYIQILGNQLGGLIRTDDAYMWLHGVWNKDPIEVKIVNESTNSRYDKLIKEAVNEWSFLLKQTSRNWYAWNFIYSNNPNIIVHIEDNPDGCKASYADIWGHTDNNERIVRPVDVYVLSSCNGITLSDSAIKSIAIHEIGHALGLGHTWNVDGDLMCSTDLGKVTCGGSVPRSKTPTSLNVEALLFLYGTDGFAEPNQASPILNEYRLGMVGIVFDKPIYNNEDSITVTVIFPKGDASLREKNAIEGMAISSLEKRKIVFYETGEGGGTFRATIRISYDVSVPRDLTVSEHDTVEIGIKFNNEVFSKTVSIAEVVAVSEKKWNKLQLSQPEILHAGTKTAYVSLGSDVIISVNVSNLQQAKQEFTLFTQIKNSDGITVYLNTWHDIAVDVDYPFNIIDIQDPLWIPSENGTYTVQIFTWESVDNPVPLAPVTSTQVFVSET